MTTNTSWSIDDKRINFQFGCEMAWRVKDGKRRPSSTRTRTTRASRRSSGGRATPWAGARSWVVWGTPNCGKGQPGQVGRVGPRRVAGPLPQRPGGGALMPELIGADGFRTVAEARPRICRGSTASRSSSCTSGAASRGSRSPRSTRAPSARTRGCASGWSRRTAWAWPRHERLHPRGRARGRQEREGDGGDRGARPAVARAGARQPVPEVDRYFEETATASPEASGRRRGGPDRSVRGRVHRRGRVRDPGGGVRAWRTPRASSAGRRRPRPPSPRSSRAARAAAGSPRRSRAASTASTPSPSGRARPTRRWRRSARAPWTPGCTPWSWSPPPPPRSWGSWRGWGSADAATSRDGPASAASRDEQVAAPGVQIWDDGTDPRTLGAPFDFEGVPRRHVDLIKDGVFLDAVYDLRTGKEAGVPSTGHALPSPNPEGPFPLNLFMGTGDATVEEMIRATERGVLVTRFHYSNVVNPMESTITGMTRDGTFLIERGEIVGPVRNFRFTQSILGALASDHADRARRRAGQRVLLQRQPRARPQGGGVQLLGRQRPLRRRDRLCGPRRARDPEEEPMQVGEIMHTDVKTADAEDTFADVAKLMRTQRHLLRGRAGGQEAGRDRHGARHREPGGGGRRPAQRARSCTA